MPYYKELKKQKNTCISHSHQLGSDFMKYYLCFINTFISLEKNDMSEQKIMT